VQSTKGSPFIRINGYCWECKKKYGCKYKFEIQTNPFNSEVIKVSVKTLGKHIHDQSQLLEKSIRNLSQVKTSVLINKESKAKEIQDTSLKAQFKMKKNKITIQKKKLKRNVKEKCLSIKCYYCSKIEYESISKCSKCKNSFHIECNEEELSLLLNEGENVCVNRCVVCYKKIAPQKFKLSV
jgi:hypothetical protein